MIRSLIILLSCVMLMACGGGSSNNATANPDPAGGGNSLVNSLNPTAIVVESPPVNGQLPADLQPPV